MQTSACTILRHVLTSHVALLTFAVRSFVPYVTSAQEMAIGRVHAVAAIHARTGMTHVAI